MNLYDKIAHIPDCPKEGILFHDVTPLMADGEAFREACQTMIEFAKKVNADALARFIDHAGCARIAMPPAS